MAVSSPRREGYGFCEVVARESIDYRARIGDQDGASALCLCSVGTDRVALKDAVGDVNLGRVVEAESASAGGVGSVVDEGAVGNCDLCAFGEDGAASLSQAVPHREPRHGDDAAATEPKGAATTRAVDFSLAVEREERERLVDENSLAALGATIGPRAAPHADVEPVAGIPHGLLYGGAGGRLPSASGIVMPR